MRTFMGSLDKGGQIETAAVKEAITRFYQIYGQLPKWVLVRPGFANATAETVKGLGLPTVRVGAGNMGILAGEVWME